MPNTSYLLVQRSACQALVITCADFRFKSAERAFLTSQGLTDDYDLLAKPGGIRAIAQPRSTAARDTLLEDIRLLRGLHEFKRVLAINHLSCRAYDDLATAENELQVHTEHLARAAEIIQQGFADVRVETYIAMPKAGEIVVVPARQA